ncbi:MAG: GNAT family N-acetyltransferase [Mobilitalea sp.]
MGRITISKENINSIDANELIDELSNELNEITGNSGRGSFDNSDVDKQRSMFVIAREDEKAVGCGAFREISSDTAEIKRMYVRTKSRGIGEKILIYLEEKAKEYGYCKIVLETRKCNQNAVKFYLNNGYEEIKNYGKYENSYESICFEKKL